MNTLSLNGNWSCCLPDGRELDAAVPGCWDALVPEKDIAETVVYTKRFTVHKKQSHYQLFFGAVSYYCEVFLNGVPVGIHEGMWDSFRLDVTEALRDGENELRLEVVKPGYHDSDRFPLRQVLSGFIPDVLCTFGGIWDEVRLEEAPACFILCHHAMGHCDGKGKLSLSVDVKQAGPMRIEVTLYAPDGSLAGTLEGTRELTAGEHPLNLDFVVEQPACWEPDAPSLYRYELKTALCGQEETLTGTFGFRDLSTDGPRILLNNRPVYARGVLHWGCYDEEIIPNPSPAVIESEIKACKQYGFNMIKHCLYIPRESYLELADEMGMLLWIELPVWLPDPTEELGPRIKREFPRILSQLQGHPSVVLISLGCELDSKVEGDILEEMYHLAKESSSALVRDNSGSGECYDGLSVDFADFFDYHFYGDLQNMENLMETFTPGWRSYRPWLYGEFCDSDTMRDLSVLRKRKGVERLWWEVDDPHTNPISILKPDFRAGCHEERMEQSGIRADYEELKKLSYDHALTHRKTTLEQTRSFPEIGGYNITSIRDVAIATSGIFDDMMQPKFDSELFRRFNSDVMLVPAWDLTRIWINADRVMNRERYNFFGGENYSLHILLSNYGKEPIENPVVEWKLLRDGAPVLQGTASSKKTIPCGTVSEAGYLYFTLPETDTPETLLLEAQVTYPGGTAVNSWPIFLYPQPANTWVRLGVYDPCNLFTTLEELYPVSRFSGETVPENVDVVVCSVLTPAIRKYMEEGGKVFYLQRGAGSLPVTPVAFWREGILRPYDHPVLAGLKRECPYDDLRYFSLSTDTALDTFQIEKEGMGKVVPILRRYDCREWLATDYIAEFAWGSGRMIASTLRFEGGMGKEPLFIRNNRFGRWLLEQIFQTLLKP